MDYLMQEREKGFPVTNRDLQGKALAIARNIEDRKLESFKASDGWLRRWKKRNRVALLRGTSEAQKIPEDFGDQIKEFRQRVKHKRQEHSYTDFNIGEQHNGIDT